MVAVACIFNEDGKVTVQRIAQNGKWMAVSQGRQWTDVEGMHVLVMFPDEQVRELLLIRSSLNWTIRTPAGNKRVWV